MKREERDLGERGSRVKREERDLGERGSRVKREESRAGNSLKSNERL